MSRIIIEGEIDGFKVTVNVEEADLAKYNEDGEFIGITELAEVGVIPALVDQVRNHGVQPAFRKNSYATTADVSSEPKKARWECPEHKNASVFPSNFDKTKLECKRWAEATDRNNPPAWAKTKVAEVNGQLRWYCKYREN